MPVFLHNTPKIVNVSLNYIENKNIWIPAIQNFIQNSFGNFALYYKKKSKKPLLEPSFYFIFKWDEKYKKYFYCKSFTAYFNL